MTPPWREVGMSEVHRRVERIACRKLPAYTPHEHHRKTEERLFYRDSIRVSCFCGESVDVDLKEILVGGV